MSGKTPMTTLKFMGAAVLIMAVLAYAGYTMYFKPAHTVTNDNYFNDGVIVSGGGTVQLNVIPMANAQTPTVGPTFVPTPTPTPAPTIAPTPTPGADGNIEHGTIVYVTPGPTKAPVIILGTNNDYRDGWNYFKCRDLHLNYTLTPNLKLKAGSTYNLKAVFQNQGAPIEHTVGTITATTLNDDPNLNILLFTDTIYDDRRTVDRYESFTIDKKITVPSYRGHYKLYVVVTCDNGAKAEIMQEVTIV
jgi:hypothetical protein